MEVVVVRTPESRQGGTGASPERREFLRRLLGASEPGSSPRERLSAEKIALLREMAARWRGDLSAGGMPEVHLSAACAHHGSCVAVCPTLALRAYSGEGSAGLVFEPAACIGCGVCALVCPEAALTLRAVAAAPVRAPYSVSCHAMRACARCDDEFAERGEEELCPACRKDVRLFTTGFSAGSQEP
jgi:Fe-S-cluster-containing dehydrogenase component